MLRTRLCRTLLLSLVASALLGFSAPVAAQEASEPTLRFVGVATRRRDEPVQHLAEPKQDTPPRRS